MMASRTWIFTQNVEKCDLNLEVVDNAKLLGIEPK